MLDELLKFVYPDTDLSEMNLKMDQLKEKYIITVNSEALKKVKSQIKN